MSKRLLGVSIFIVALGVYSFFHSWHVNPVDQNNTLISLQTAILKQLELQSDVLVAMRKDSLSERE